MAVLAGVVAVASVVIGLGVSVNLDAPGGPAIVLAMACLAGLSLAYAAARGGG
jgi:zinc transport system permease protein